MRRFFAGVVPAIGLLLGGSAAATVGTSASWSAADFPVPPAVRSVPAPPAEAPGRGTDYFDRRARPVRRGTDALLTAVSAEPAAPKARSSAGVFRELPDNEFASFGTGTVYFTDAVLSGEERLTDVEAGFSSAAFSSAPLPAQANEMGRPLAPKLAAGDGVGRGVGLDFGFSQGLDPEQLLGLDSKVEAKAPPSRDVVTKEAANLKLTPLLNADALTAQAAARSAATGCVLGSDLAFGLGSASNAQLVAESEQAASVLATEASDPPRGVSQTLSRTYLVPREGGPSGRFGLLSETRATIAPITLFEETDDEFTVELLGEWVFRVQADGRNGRVTFGPDVDSEGDRPVLRLFDAEGKVVDDVTVEQFLGEDGSVVEVPGVAEVVIGEDPRAIGGDAKSKPTVSSTLVTASVDVVRVRLLDDGAGGAANLRVGHMEVGVAVPTGGIECPGIGMTKASDSPSVKAGDRFSWTITLTNPNDCVLDGVTLVDTITAPRGLEYRITGTNPTATSTGDSTLTFEGIGPLRMGESRTVRIDAEVASGPVGGALRDEAVASGTCGATAVGGAARGSTRVDKTAAAPVPLAGRVSLEGPGVAAVSSATAEASPLRPGPIVPAPAGPPTARTASAAPAGRTGSGLPASAPATLARTGGAFSLLPAVSLLGFGVLLRQLRQRRGRPA